MQLLHILLSHLLQILPFYPVMAGLFDNAPYYFANQYISAIECFEGVSAIAEGIFGGSGTVGKICDNLNATAVSWSETFAGLGVVLGFVAWVIAVVELATQDRLTPETFVKSFAKLGVAIVCCSLCSTIISGIYDFGQAITSDVGSITLETAIDASGESFDLDADTLGEAVSDYLGGKFDGIALMLEGVIVSLPARLCAMAMTICLYIICLSRSIEMNVRAAFLGISFGLLADDGWRGPGANAIKKFLALCCQGAVLVMIAKVYAAIVAACATSLISDISGTGTLSDLSNYASASVLLLAGGGFAAIGLMFKSLGIINDVFGAH